MSYKDILIYCIGYVTIKVLKYVKIYSVNPLYLIFCKVNGYFEEINENIVIRKGKIVWKHEPHRPFFLCNLSSENS